jgi:hypothetical protein
MATKMAPEEAPLPPEKDQMKVLLLGLPLTNTASLTAALRHLGYNPYTTRSLAASPSHMAVWRAAIPSTSHTATTLPLDVAALLAGHSAVADLPACMFAAQLIGAYPAAKVILTTRDSAEWEQAMQGSVWALFTWRVFQLVRIAGLGQLAPLVRLLHALFGVHNGNVYGGVEARRAAERHNARVRALVPRERLLEVDARDEVGWQRLCAFLGEGPPPEGLRFPRVRDEEGAMRRALEASWAAVARWLVLMVGVNVVVVALSVAAWVYAGELRGARDAWVLGPVREYLKK